MTDVMPGGLSISKGANWNQAAIMNRASGVVNYSDSASATISFDIELFATHKDKAKDEVAAVVKGLQALVHPVRPGLSPPPLCQITVGSGTILSKYYCVCDSVSPQLRGPWTRDRDPMAATVSLSFTEIDDKNLDAKAVAGSKAGFGANHLVPWTRSR